MTMSATMPPQTRTTPAPAAGGLKAWLATRQNRLLAAGGAVLLLVVVAGLVVLSIRRKEAFAGRALDQARGIAEAGNLPLAASELQKVITTYGGTRAAQEAVINLNQVRLINGQQELAVVGLEEFLAANPDQQFRAPAYGLLGRALENAGKSAEAAEAYLKASAEAGSAYIKAEMLLDAGRAYRNGGKTEEAITLYRRILTEFKDTPFVTEGEVRLAELTQGVM
jgi:tetratricopeptide (TPR) repeat protein